MLLGISGILLAIVVFNIVFRGANPLFAGILALVGILLGMFVFSRMNKIVWDEEAELVQTQKMDIVGYGILALYIAFELGLRTFLHDYFPITATALLLAGVFGVLFGRVIGSVVEIHRVYTSSHA
jgi:hypothetical protein